MELTDQNMDLMARWLDGHSYETRYQPVPIHEHLVYNGDVFPAASTRDFIRKAAQLDSQRSAPSQAVPTKRIEPSQHKEFGDPVLNAVVSLAQETASTGFGALVFAASRGLAESDALWISRVMPASQDISPELLDKRLDLLSDLRSLSTGLDPVLEQTIPFGVAFHRELAHSRKSMPWIANTR